MPAALAATVVFAVPLVVRVFNDASVNSGQRTVVMSDSVNVTESPERTESFAPEPPEQATRPMVEPARPAVSSSRVVGNMAEPAEADLNQAPVAVSLSLPDAGEEERMKQSDDSVASAALERQDDMAEQRQLAAPLRAERYEDENFGSTVAEDRIMAGNTSAAVEMESNQESVATSLEATTIGKYSKPAADTLFNRDDLPSPTVQLQRIRNLMQQQQVLAARHVLGIFLHDNPGYRLPADFPLREQDAIDVNQKPDNTNIVPEAESWLRGIGELAEQGQTDRARMQLAEFFRIYRDYRLPADFPLTRDDAAPIDR